MSIKSITTIAISIVFLASTATLFGQADVAKAGLSEKGLERYENFLNQEIAAKRVAGAVTAIARHGQLAHHKAMGHNSLTDMSAMKTDQIFYIQSMTKPVISVAFMTLYEDGHFFLTDPVSKYLPGFDDMKVMQAKKDEDGNVTGVEYVAANKPIEIWHLLSHTAGFSHGLSEMEYDVNLRKLLYETPHKTIEDRVTALAGYPLMGHPGEQWNYSASPDVLALLIEKFSGKTVPEFLQERIFGPLEMGDTGYNVPEKDANRVAGLHQYQEDGTLIAADQWSPSSGNTVFGGTHGLYSTAADYLKFGLMLVNGGKGNGHRVLSRKTLELMTDNHIEGLPYQAGNGFGLGFGIRTDVSDSKISGSEGIFHWGGAFNTYFFVDQEEQLVSVLMTQSWPYTNHYASKMRQLVYSAIDD